MVLDRLSTNTIGCVKILSTALYFVCILSINDVDSKKREKNVTQWLWIIEIVSKKLSCG